MAKTSQNLEQVVYVGWEESERGWGTRPDGCSLHLGLDNYRKYLEEHWQGMPNFVPDEYDRPAGEPITITVTKDIYARVEKNDGNLRLCQSELHDLREKNKILYGGKSSGWMPLA